MVETHLAAHQRALAVMFAVAVLATTTVGGSAWAQTPLRIDPGIIDPRGLAWDGSHFWFIGGLNSDNNVLFRLNPQSGVIDPQATLPSPDFGDVRAIAWRRSDETFWIADDETHLIWNIRVGPSAPSVAIESRFGAPDRDFRKMDVTGLEWDDRPGKQGLWICTSQGLCTTIRKLNVGEHVQRRVIASFYPVCDPRGLVIAGGKLWSVAFGQPPYSSKLLSFSLSDDDDWRSMKASRSFGWAVAGTAPVGLSRRDQHLWVLDQNDRLIRSLKVD